MRIADGARLLRLLGRVASSASPRNVREVHDPSGRLGLYWPRRGRPRGGVVVVHGVTPHGGRDARLVHFARCLAASGVGCAVPTLEQLAVGRWDPSDLLGLQEAMSRLFEETGRRVGVIGFSFGGSYALVTAARQAVAEKIRFVITFGAYHALGQLLRDHLTQDEAASRSAQQQDDYLYLRFVFAADHADKLGLSPEQRELLQALLFRYCDDATAAEKGQLYARHLQGIDWSAIAPSTWNAADLAALSPQGNLAGLRCPVHLLHDPDDSIVAPAQARALLAELRATSAAASTEHQLLFTTLLCHVSIRDRPSLGELWRLAQTMAPLVS